MAALEPYDFEPNSESDSSEDSEVDNQLKKKKHFADIPKDSKSVAGFSPFRQFWVRQNDVT